MKRIALLGSTGSIGTSTLEVVAHLGDEIEVVSLAAHSNITLLEQQIEIFRPKFVTVFDDAAALKLKKQMPGLTICIGREGLIAAATDSDIDFVIMGMLGMEALAPTMAAIEAGKGIGLANKEILVAAGELVMNAVARKGVTLIPIDSEHSALFQCLTGEDKASISRLILTASGGPFRNHTQSQLKTVSVEDALAHPTWKMGAKITIDSSTLMNKGFELIEAAFLFGMPPEKLEIVIHPQSIIHSMVEFADGAIKAEMSAPSMVLPIQYALTYPNRTRGSFAPFDFTKSHSLEFFPPDSTRFPALKLAYHALQEKGSLPCYLNAINEVLVAQFLERKISWTEITSRLQKLFDSHRKTEINSVEEALTIDQEGKREALAL